MGADVSAIPPRKKNVSHITNVADGAINNILFEFESPESSANYYNDYDKLDRFVKLSLARGSQVDALRSLIRTKNFLLLLLTFLNNNKSTCEDYLLANFHILGNLMLYANIYSSTKVLAETFAQSCLEHKKRRWKYNEVTGTYGESVYGIELTIHSPLFHTNTVADENLIIMTVLHLLPKFLYSIEYKSLWCQYVKATDNSLCHIFNKIIEVYPYTKFDSLTSYEGTSAKEKAFNSIHPEYVKTLSESKYLNSFITAVEYLPIGVSIIAVKETLTEGLIFPIIYVNEMYTHIRGYPKHSIVQKDFVTAHCNTTDNRHSPIIQTSLNNQKSLNIVFNNYTQHGIKFKHFYSMQPLLDSHGKYAYVIGLHFDCTMKKSENANRILMNRLLSFLPLQLYDDFWSFFTN